MPNARPDDVEPQMLLLELLPELARAARKAGHRAEAEASFREGIDVAKRLKQAGELSPEDKDLPADLEKELNDLLARPDRPTSRPGGG